jgi:hypothetical protein
MRPNRLENALAALGEAMREVNAAIEEMRAKHDPLASQRCAPSIASSCRCQGDAFTIQKTGCCENSAIKLRNFIGSESYTPS